MRCPIIYGFKTLSPVPTTTTDQTRSPIAKPVFPVMKRKIIEGTDTTAVPSGGIIEAMPAMTAQMAGLGT